MERHARDRAARTVQDPRHLLADPSAQEPEHIADSGNPCVPDALLPRGGDRRRPREGGARQFQQHDPAGESDAADNRHAAAGPRAGLIKPAPSPEISCGGRG